MRRARGGDRRPGSRRRDPDAADERPPLVERRRRAADPARAPAALRGGPARRPQLHVRHRGVAQPRVDEESRQALLRYDGRAPRHRPVGVEARPGLRRRPLPRSAPVEGRRGLQGRGRGGRSHPPPLLRPRRARHDAAGPDPPGPDRALRDPAAVLHRLQARADRARHARPRALGQPGRALQALRRAGDRSGAEAGGGPEDPGEARLQPEQPTAGPGLALRGERTHSAAQHEEQALQPERPLARRRDLRRRADPDPRRAPEHRLRRGPPHRGREGDRRDPGVPRARQAPGHLRRAQGDRGRGSSQEAPGARGKDPPRPDAVRFRRGRRRHPLRGLEPRRVGSVRRPPCRVADPHRRLRPLVLLAEPPELARARRPRLLQVRGDGEGGEGLACDLAGRGTLPAVLGGVVQAGGGGSRALRREDLRQHPGDDRGAPGARLRRRGHGAGGAAALRAPRGRRAAPRRFREGAGRPRLELRDHGQLGSGRAACLVRGRRRTGAQERRQDQALPEHREAVRVPHSLRR